MATLLQITPDHEIVFEISQTSDPPPKAYLTLKHTGVRGSSSEPIAFKVKTTQPRRYLVRPNQGLLPAGGTAQVQILLVEKDTQALWQNFVRLGQASLDHCKDKFLVQSTSVSSNNNLQPGDYDGLTAFWQSVHATSTNTSGHDAEVFHKKFPVRHVGVNTSAAAAAVAAARGAENMPTAANVPTTTGNASAAQLQTELANLSRKYDELVAFSVNLTAERDILNNTLEQTKRDLNRQLQSQAAEGNRSNSSNSALVGGSGGASNNNKSGSSFSLSTLLVLLLACPLSWLTGAYMHSHGQTGFLKDVPKVGAVLHEKINLVAATKSGNDDDDDDDSDDKEEL